MNHDGRHRLRRLPLAGVKLATRSAVATRRTARAAPVRAAADTATDTASIGETFAALKRRNQCAFVPFICAGDPNLDATEKALAILDEAGADVIELGVPYSDPLADGPTIQVRRTRLANDARLESSRRRRRGRPPRVARDAHPRTAPIDTRIAVRLCVFASRLSSNPATTSVVKKSRETTPRRR